MADIEGDSWGVEYKKSKGQESVGDGGEGSGWEQGWEDWTPTTNTLLNDENDPWETSGVGADY